MSPWKAAGVIAIVALWMAVLLWVFQIIANTPYPA